MSRLLPFPWLASTRRQSEPPGGMTRGSWLALVLTVNGLVVCTPAGPNVVVHVVPAFGIVATNPTQLAPTATPALTLTVVLAPATPPDQYIVNDHVPAATVCAGRFGKEPT